MTVSEYITASGLDRVAATARTNRGVAFLVDNMVTNIVDTGLNALMAKGLRSDALRLQKEYQAIVQGKIISSWDLGDHEPWSQWLVKFYNELETLLGHDLCVRLHLDDIWEINYAVPVVFHPKDPRWDIIEYRKHFVPLAGSISYWVSYIACEAITYGAGMVFLICTPIGDICEGMMTDYIAPDLSDYVYNRANGGL